MRFFRLTVAFMLLVVVFIAALEGWRISRDYQHAFAAASDSAGNLTRAAAQHAGDTIREVDTLLIAARERIEDDGLAADQVPRLRRLLQQQRAILPQLNALMIFDAQGRGVISDRGTAPPDAVDGVHEYFTYHRAHPERGAHVGKVITSRINGHLVIPISRRLDHPDGSFAGVLLGTLNLSYFSDYYAEFKIDQQGVFVLALRDGTILVRRPSLEGAVGLSIASGEIFQNYLPRATEGILEMTSQVDNTPRLYGYKMIPDYGLVVEAGISQAYIIAAWRRDLIKSAGVVLLFLVGLGLFGFNLFRQLRYRILMENELRQAHLTLQEVALKDSLTGLGNRRSLDLHLAAELLRAQRGRLPLALIMLDIDYFKRFNDLYGHPAGDECLRRVAWVVQRALPGSTDLAFRYGGEELTLILPDTDYAGASQVAEAVLEAIRALHLAHGDSPAGRVTASAGVHVEAPVSVDIAAQALLQAADAALYLAKQSGRDKWCAKTAS